MNKTFKEEIKEYISSTIKEATKLEKTLSEIELKENIEKFAEIRNKVRKKSYTENRLQEVVDECNINKTLEECYKLGLANAYGYIMYMLDQDLDKKDIKKFIMDSCKDDTQLKSDIFGVWEERM